MLNFELLASEGSRVLKLWQFSVQTLPLHGSLGLGAQGLETVFHLGGSGFKIQKARQGVPGALLAGSDKKYPTHGGKAQNHDEL